MSENGSSNGFESRGTIEHSPSDGDSVDSSTHLQDRIVLDEHDTSEPLRLSETALDALEKVAEDIGSTRLDIEYGRGDEIRLSSSQYVGAISLPEGPEIRIQPKAAGTNFLALLQWAHGVTSETYNEQTQASTGRIFVDALGLLYAAELDVLLNRGPHREYQRTQESEERLRGRLDLQRQLQNQAMAGTEFEVEYEELTTDTIANRGIQQAAEQLAVVAESRTLASRLKQQSRQLDRWVGDTPVSAAEIAGIQTTRLNPHYETILRLTEQILRHRYLDDFTPVGQSSHGLLVNMNTIFEKAVERTARELTIPKPDWKITSQERIQPIATGGTPPIKMYPDFVLERDGIPKLVGDAKWKTGSISQSDIYQMSAYMLALEVPGMLIYPEQTEPGVSVETSYLVDDRFELLVYELPTATELVAKQYPQVLQEGLATAISQITDSGEWVAE